MKMKSTRKSHKNPLPGIRQDYELRPIIPNNDALFQYYQSQRIIDEEEWELFVNTLKVELPSAFRIRFSLQERDHLVKYIESKFIKEISTMAQNEGKTSAIDPPKSVPFVPYGYQTKMSRTAIRSHPILKNFHEFLINETESGYISRQELCSMIPPLLLEIEPNHMILDACAAPGSKTMQILELMHKDTAKPEGMLIANDVDYKRCYLLVHQTLKRMPNANCVVTSHDSSLFPIVFDSDKKPILFDRILCDLICSGDGTFRKNPDLWKTWEPMKGINLHKLQLKIANRCVELLKPGGLICYSTCSLNPIEDEAVVAQILRTSNGTMELVDVSDKLAGLKRSQGINYWKVFSNGMEEYSSLEQVPQAKKHYFKPSMFPPNNTESEQMHLERTFRILPHHQDSGGFFVALLRKKQPLPGEDAPNVPNQFNSKKQPPKMRKFMNKEDPFVFLEEHGTDEELREEMKKHYGIEENQFPYSNLLVRSANTERKKEIYFVNDKLREFLQHNGGRFKIVNAGMGILKKITSDKIAPCAYRIKQDGLPLLSPWICKRVFDIPMEFMVKILKGTAAAAEKGKPSQYVNMQDIGEYSTMFRGIGAGSVILRMHEPFTKEICAWIGANSVSAFVSREERIHLLSILGEEDIGESYRRNAQDTTRQEKAKRFKSDNSDGRSAMEK